MDRLKTIIIAAACIYAAVACSKNDAPESSDIQADDLIVSIRDFCGLTKSVLVDSIKTNFASGDTILVYDSSEKWGKYKFRTRSGGKNRFQKVDSLSGFNRNDIVSAFYPADKVDSYSAGVFTATFGESQTFALNSFPKGAAPMTWFGTAGEEITFSNQFAVVRFSFKYDSAPATALKLDTIKLSSTTSNLSGTYTFSSTGVGYSTGGSTEVCLTGCEDAGELGTAPKYFYMAVPGISETSEAMRINVIPTTDVPFFGKFTASGNGTNRIAKNNILLLEPFKLIPVNAGGKSSYTIDKWNVIDTVKVGQITLAKTEVSVKVGEMKRIQVYGATKTESLFIDPASSSCLSYTKTKETVGETDKFYIEITGTAAGYEEMYVNDIETNSGSYLYVTVTE